MSEPPVHRPQRSCQDCGAQAAFIVDNQSWYCSKCRKYLPAAQAQQPAQPAQPHQQPPYHQPAYQQPAHPGYAQQPPYGTQPVYHPQAAQPTYAPHVQHAQPVQPIQAYQQSAHPGYGQQAHATPYQQPAQFYQPTLPNVETARAKVHNSVAHRSRSDIIVSTTWPAILIFIQLLLIAVIIFGAFSLGEWADLDISDPYASSPPNELIAAIIIAFILQIIYTMMQCYIIYALILRMDDHLDRDGLLRNGLREFIDALSISRNVDTNVERWTMNTIDMISSVKEGKKGAMTWAVLIGVFSFIPVIGIFVLLYVMHFLTERLIDHDLNQLNFNRQLNGALAKLGEPMAASGGWIHTHRRSTGLYIILAIITLGFFLPYWWYVVIKDWNIHFQNQWIFEDEILSIMRGPRG